MLKILWSLLILRNFNWKKYQKKKKKKMLFFGISFEISNYLLLYFHSCLNNQKNFWITWEQRFRRTSFQTCEICF